MLLPTRRMMIFILLSQVLPEALFFLCWAMGLLILMQYTIFNNF